MNDKLTLKMERGRLVLELPHNMLDLEVNGALQATYFLGRSAGPEDLRAELRKASAAHAACEMLREVLAPMKLPSDKRTSSKWAHGFNHGLMGTHRVLNNTHVPPEVVVEDGQPALDGWGLGYALRAALAIANGQPDPRVQG
jgi:hypothetical protein